MAIENLITDHLDLWAAAVRPKSSAGRGASSKLELTGIKKLRELILELAVRGKLVSQDPNDEPASVLLERIAAERVRLVKEGKIKKPKALPEIGEEEKPFELPEGWECIRLGDLTSKMGSGSTPRGGQSAYVSEGIPFLRSQNVWNEGLRLDDVVYIDENTHLKMEGTKVIPGDVLLNITGASLGRALIFPDSIKEANVSQHVTIIRLLIDELAPFVHLGIKSPLVQDLIWGRQVGMAIEGLSKRTLELFEFPIPPLAEQQRIVAKVDELMALCDQLEQRSEDQLTAHQTLVDTLLSTLTDSADADELAQNWTRLSTHFDTIFATEASIDYLKQTILQLAVMGKLVPQDPSDEPASALLERIATEKSILIKKGEIKKSLSTDSVIMDNCNWALSSGWSSVELQNIFRFIDYRGKNPEKSSHGVRLITAKNIRNGVIKNEPVEYISKELYDEWMVRGFPKKRDILFITEGHTMGFVAQVHLDFKFALAQRTICLQPYSEIVPEYLLIALMTMQFQKSVKDNETGSAAGGIKASKLKRLLLPIPPLEEQTRIVSKAERLLSLCDQLKSRLQTSQQTQLALAESLVEGALA